jgi:hypothetical protein
MAQKIVDATHLAEETFAHEKQTASGSVENTSQSQLTVITAEPSAASGGLSESNNNVVEKICSTDNANESTGTLQSGALETNTLTVVESVNHLERLFVDLSESIEELKDLAEGVNKVCTILFLQSFTKPKLAAIHVENMFQCGACSYLCLEIIYAGWVRGLRSSESDGGHGCWI